MDIALSDSYPLPDFQPDHRATGRYTNRIQLWSDGFYRTPKIHYDKTTLTGRPFYYFAYGAACSEVAIDT